MYFRPWSTSLSVKLTSSVLASTSFNRFYCSKLPRWRFDQMSFTTNNKGLLSANGSDTTKIIRFFERMVVISMSNLQEVLRQSVSVVQVSLLDMVWSNSWWILQSSIKSVVAFLMLWMTLSVTRTLSVFCCFLFAAFNDCWSITSSFSFNYYKK